MQQTSGTENGTSSFDVAKVVELKKGDGCWFEKKTGGIVLLRGVGMHPMQKLARMIGLEECYQSAEQLREHLQTLFTRLNLNLSVSLQEEKSHGVHFTFC